MNAPTLKPFKHIKTSELANIQQHPQTKHFQQINAHQQDQLTPTHQPINTHQLHTPRLIRGTTLSSFLWNFQDMVRHLLSLVWSIVL
jgi:hypothetical protein